MKSIASVLLLLGGAGLMACNSADSDSAYEVADPTEVTLQVTGMT